MTMTSHPPTNGQVATRRDALEMGRKPAGQLSTLHEFLKTRRGALSAIGATHMDPERVYRIVLACVTRTPALQRCSIESVFRASLQACEMGLEPGSALGEAYLVPYKDTCQLIPGYRGLITLARRSGEVEQVYAYCVYEGDEFRIQKGTDPSIVHVDGPGARTPDKILHVYAVAVLVGGARQFDSMTKAEVDAIRQRSAARTTGPWVTDYAEMAKKTVVKRLLKYVPMSVENKTLSKALALDTAIDTGDWSAVEFELDESVAPTVEEAQFRESAAEATRPARGVNAVKDKIANATAQMTVERADPAEMDDNPSLPARARFMDAAKAAGYPLQSDSDAESLLRNLLKLNPGTTPTDEEFEQGIAVLLSPAADLFKGE